MSTLLALNHFGWVTVLKSADIKEKKKKKLPRIRLISEDKAAKPFSLSRTVNLHSE